MATNFTFITKAKDSEKIKEDRICEGKSKQNFIASLALILSPPFSEISKYLLESMGPLMIGK
jgi:hypothetical protein